MRESDANKLSQGLQVPLQELDVTALRAVLMNGWGQMDVTT
jgi:hypothetical protein